MPNKCTICIQSTQGTCSLYIFIKCDACLGAPKLLLIKFICNIRFCFGTIQLNVNCNRCKMCSNVCSKNVPKTKMYKTVKPSTKNPSIQPLTLPKRKKKKRTPSYSNEIIFIIFIVATYLLCTIYMCVWVNTTDAYYTCREYYIHHSTFFYVRLSYCALYKLREYSHIKIQITYKCMYVLNRREKIDCYGRRTFFSSFIEENSFFFPVKNKPPRHTIQLDFNVNWHTIEEGRKLRCLYRITFWK